MQLSSRLSALFVLLVTLTCCPVQGQDYDLAILNGLVMDPESGLDGVRSVTWGSKKVRSP
jgi:hypothetical protein